ncbi:hypothetical protein GEMRC1_010667 [Eukaryota sp. GEM-RC1]
MDDSSNQYVISAIKSLRELVLLKDPSECTEFILDQLLNLDITDIDPILLLTCFDEWKEPVLLEARTKFSSLKLMPHMLSWSRKQSHQTTDVITELDIVENMMETVLEVTPDDSSSKFEESASCKVVLLGLGGSGKTTLFYQLQDKRLDCYIPTIGFNVETVFYKQTKFNLWDIGGGCGLWPLWRHYYQDSHVIFFVIDALDRPCLRCSKRCKDCAYCLYQIVAQELDHLFPKPRICFLLNKCDGSDPISTETLIETLELPPDSPVFVCFPFFLIPAS